MAITPFNVTDFGTNRKPICDFLLVINTNLPLILHPFQVMARSPRQLNVLLPFPFSIKKFNSSSSFEGYLTAFYIVFGI